MTPQGHLYLEVANPAPFVGDKSYAGKKVYPNGSSHPGTTLYTDTVDELNPTTGKLMWHYQLTPHDIHDWDLNNQALITTVNGKETIISAGKAGIAIANDAQTGKLQWKTPIGQHNGHDNDGIKARTRGQEDPEAPVHDAAGRRSAASRRRMRPTADRLLPGQQHSGARARPRRANPTTDPPRGPARSWRST